MSAAPLVCTICGCTVDDACITGNGQCHWVSARGAPLVCSACEYLSHLPPHARLAATTEMHRRDENRIELALRAAYPKGAPIRWVNHGHICVGVVVEHGNIDRIKVRNAASDRTYWISAYWVGAAGLAAAARA